MCETPVDIGHIFSVAQALHDSMHDEIIGKQLTHKRKSLHVTKHAKSDPDMNRVDCMLFNIRYDLNIRN